LARWFSLRRLILSKITWVISGSRFHPHAFSPAWYPRTFEHGFLVLNVLLFGFGAWCFIYPVRRAWPVAASLVWFWVAIEIINGIVHPLWSLREGGYTPGPSLGSGPASPGHLSRASAAPRVT
jgi:hypothetical protein